MLNYIAYSLVDFCCGSRSTSGPAGADPVSKPIVDPSAVIPPLIDGLR